MPNIPPHSASGRRRKDRGATKFYAKLLGIEGKRHPGARHYFDCGGVILAVLDARRAGSLRRRDRGRSTSR